MNRTLASKGYEETSSAPDFLIAMQAGRRDRISITSDPYTRGYRGWYGGGVDVHEYEEGVLILDLVDAKKKELFWSGKAQKILDPSPTPEQIEATINKAVEKMLEKFPPPPK